MLILENRNHYSCRRANNKWWFLAAQVRFFLFGHDDRGCQISRPQLQIQSWFSWPGPLHHHQQQELWQKNRLIIYPWWHTNCRASNRIWYVFPPCGHVWLGYYSRHFTKKKFMKLPVTICNNRGWAVVKSIMRFFWPPWTVWRNMLFNKRGLHFVDLLLPELCSRSQFTRLLLWIL